MGFERVGVWRSAACAAIGVALLLLLPAPAKAIPAFAAQTGQPCQMCHVGGFGPQLTPYGRTFKLTGYTQRSGPINIPLAVMAIASYIRTDKDQPAPPAPHFHDNDNVALDQANLFLAGGIGSHFGGFVQATYDGVGRSFTWDNTDLRAVTTFDVGKTNVLLGASLNNNPTVQDVWNTLPAWGFPYTSSALAPSPAAAPVIAGAFAQETVGLTGYAWVNAEYYAEAGAYASPNASLLTHLGVDPTSPGQIDGAAPYVRLAVQKAIAGHNVEVGAFFFQAGIFPGRDKSAGTSDVFRDIGLDASDVMTLANTDVITLNARFTDERQSLRASVPLGLAANPHDWLDDFRIDASYYWRNRVGGTIQVFDTWGSADPLLYAASRTFKPDSSGVMLQIDGTPFGGASQPKRRLNLRAGLQYIAYGSFNGAGTNFDGAGRRASDQNTLRTFLWVAF